MSAVPTLPLPMIPTLNFIATPPRAKEYRPPPQPGKHPALIHVLACPHSSQHHSRGVAVQTIDHTRGKKNGNGHRSHRRAAPRRRSQRGHDRELLQLLEALEAVERGDFSVRLPHDGPGLMSDVMSAF